MHPGVTLAMDVGVTREGRLPEASYKAGRLSPRGCPRYSLVKEPVGPRRTGNTMTVLDREVNCTAMPLACRLFERVSGEARRHGAPLPPAAAGRPGRRRFSRPGLLVHNSPVAVRGIPPGGGARRR